MRRPPKSFRLSADAAHFLFELSTARGQSMTAVLERVIREEYARELKMRLESEFPITTTNQGER